MLMQDVQEKLEQAQQWLVERPDMDTLAKLALLLAGAWLANFIVKKVLLGGLLRILSYTPAGKDKRAIERNIISRLANVVPALVIAFGIGSIPNLPDALTTVITNVCYAFIVITIARSISGTLTIVNTLYERQPDAHERPIKGYIQIVKIVIYAVASILMVAVLIDKSPVILLSGLGAMAAVLMLVFQDTLLSLVASVQITSNDIIRVGDWVEMPNLNADGDVIDIALHQVKVQNWDKTITFIPTRRFISDSFKNWRGMVESGGRRVKRSLLLDQQSVHFLTDDEEDTVGRFQLLKDYLKDKQQELEDWNQKLEDAGKDPVNTRRITNIGTFRAYVLEYLKHHPKIHQEMTLMVRLLNPTSDGLPIEIYCFTDTTEWTKYESIQSDIFDHLLSILPEFGLRVFQHPSGIDMREMTRELRQQDQEEYQSESEDDAPEEQEKRESDA
ncbi:Miniconductance mechanosensitive channel YbdG [Pseudidiomarina piscicola]|uniref:Miniconductance mechanosensitive channel YbdG n=1 Tax=Pseudidiomarina piscicola TaxID=2614830 RepID=A0A6S6WNP5_9GAMM|nr:mechanosensitive ion channel family protein [Pseudidiomarina piscicola]CAB0151565.1 Miniconductance mechanosensitive channel YbdG [Pseudidiomarina piscicola]VZT41030.1 Miniconductance mechanosensitive channel YbdG [Pseudomonas aeruginosa]